MESKTAVPMPATIGPTNEAQAVPIPELDPRPWRGMKDRKLPTPVSSTQGNARKDTDNRARYDLIAAWPLHQVAMVYTFGAKKYDDHNWRKGLRWGIAFAALMRHAWAWMRGQDVDPESGLHPLAHAVFWCFALMEYGRSHPELDDRFVDAPIRSHGPGPMLREAMSDDKYGGMVSTLGKESV